LHSPPLSCHMTRSSMSLVSTVSVFFVNDTAPTDIYTLSLHDALPISGDLITHLDGEQIQGLTLSQAVEKMRGRVNTPITLTIVRDRKSTRLNSSHVKISYAVFCLKKKKTNTG